MQNKEEQESHLAIPRKALMIAFIKRLYEQKNLQKICVNDDMIVPLSRFDDWCHDMGRILGESIQDLIV